MASREDLAALLAAREMGQLDQLEQIPGQPPESVNAPIRKVVGGLAQGAVDAFTGPGRALRGEMSREEMADWAPSMALGMLAPGRPAGSVGSGAGRIKTYHSSPHDFDKFEISKLRTGQGAASYGEGFYLAESPKVSGQGGQYYKEFSDKMKSTMSETEDRAFGYLRAANYDRGKAIEMMDEILKRRAAQGFNDDRLHPRLQEARALLSTDARIGPRTYEVAIDAKPEQILNWDKPLAHQPSKPHERLDPNVRDTIDKLYDERGYNAMSDVPEEYTGKDLHRMLTHPEVQESMPAVIGRSDWYKGNTTERLHAAEYLSSLDLPVTKYLDANSRLRPPPAQDPAMTANVIRVIERDLANAREAGDVGKAKLFENELDRYTKPPTHNYVVRDPGRLEVLKKYAIPGLLTGGAAGEAVRDQPY